MTESFLKTLTYVLKFSENKHLIEPKESPAAPEWSNYLDQIIPLTCTMPA